jgi:hypothetical protein
MNVIVTVSRGKEKTTYMKTFTIDEQNNITAFATPEEAAAATPTPFDSFANQKELFRLAAGWPADRLVAIWNTLPGGKEVKAFKSTKAGVSRIWERIQKLGGADKPKSEPENPKAGRKAKGGAQAARVSSAKGKPGKKSTPAKKASKAKATARNGKPAESESGPREGTKTAQVVAMLQHKNGATLAEIMDKMRWQKHTVRGFMAGAMKKAGYTVESFKSDKGDRTYRINQ